jgi:hypothetical protein
VHVWSAIVILDYRLRRSVFLAATAFLIALAGARTVAGGGQWGPWVPYGYYGVNDLPASIRIEAEPREAQVFVDGYYAGVVDDFDGASQRLRLAPGGATITLYLEGYRTEQRRLYLPPGVDQRVRLTMQRLAPGERSEPPMAPGDGNDVQAGDVARAGDQPPPADVPGREPSGERVLTASMRVGILALRIDPADVEVLIDGERWVGAAGQPLIEIRLAEGRHRLEVRRAGLTTYTQDVLIQRDQTLTLRIELR